MPNFGKEPGDLLKTVLENVGVAIGVVDSQGKFVFANEPALTMFAMSGLPPPMHIRDWARDYRFQDRLGRDIPTEHSALARAVAGEKVEPQDVRVTLPDGRCKWLHTSTHPFSVMGLTGVLIIVTDETKEVELRRAAAEVQHMEDVGSIAAGLAHNFNNVLSTISMNAELALTEQGVPQTTRDRLQQITDASWKAAALIKRLMQFSRRRELQPRRLQVNWLVGEVLNLVRPILLDNVQVRTDLREGLPEIEADPAEMEQVLVNLIVNARDAMPNGGELTIATEIGDAESEGIGDDQTKQRFVIITVADTGIGIKEEIQERIFEPFFTTKTAERGTGLGLSSAYGIVQQHGGKIAVWSAPGKGAKFTISLPARQTVRLEQGGMVA
jgi:signal transduction histidine kinase